MNKSRVQASGVFVQQIDPGTLADAMGLAVGDEILSINDVSISDKDLHCEKALLSSFWVLIISLCSCDNDSQRG